MKIIRTLMVDDSPEFIEAAQRFLETDPSIEVIEYVHYGKDALDRIRSLQPDLVLLDINMPDVNGLEVLRQVREYAHPPKVIILTLYDNIEYQKKAKKLDADGFVQKYDFGVELLPLIHSLFADN
ncbi:MAG: response regulator transcription factor [Chloroflexota bacterium]|nr:response regulator transcription factor [Chloroflexota bacterium]